MDSKVGNNKVLRFIYDKILVQVYASDQTIKCLNHRAFVTYITISRDSLFIQINMYIKKPSKIFNKIENIFKKIKIIIF